MYANASKFLPTSDRSYEKRRLRDKTISSSSQPNPFLFPWSPWERQSGIELAAGCCLNRQQMSLSSLSVYHRVGVVEEEVVGTTILGDVCHQGQTQFKYLYIESRFRWEWSDWSKYRDLKTSLSDVNMPCITGSSSSLILFIETSI